MLEQETTSCHRSVQQQIMCTVSVILIAPVAKLGNTLQMHPARVLRLLTPHLMPIANLHNLLISALPSWF